MKRKNAINPLQLTYRYVDAVEHDFEACGPCYVSIELQISNMIQNSQKKICCYLQTRSTEDENVVWVGKTKQFVEDLDSNEIRTVTLKAAIMQPGVYDINKFYVSIVKGHHQDASETPQGMAKVHEIRLPDQLLFTATSSTAKAAPPQQLI